MEATMETRSKQYTKNFDAERYRLRPAKELSPSGPDRKENQLFIIVAIVLLLLFFLQLSLFETVFHLTKVIHIITWYILPALLFVFVNWRLTVLRRQWEGTPLCKIGEMQPGPVRVKGRVKRLHDLVVPNTHIRVAFLRHTHIVRRDDDTFTDVSDSSDNPFYLVDDTGRVLVDPREAAIETTMVCEDDKPKFGYIWNMETTEDNYDFLPDGEPVTVIGFARELEAKDSPRTRRVIERLREIKSDPELLAKYDLDGDGVIDEAEWEAVRREATEEIARRPQGRIERLMIGKPPLESAPYYIGKDSPVESFRWKFMIALGVYAGLTLLVIVPMYFGSMWFRDLLMLLLED